MSKPSDTPEDWEKRREQIIGLGDRSARKSYYPELLQRLRELNSQTFFFEKAQELGQIGSWEYDFQQDSFKVTRQTCRIYEVPYGTKPSYRQFLRAVYPPDRRSLVSCFNEALNGSLYDIEYRIVIGGRIKWVRDKAELEFAPNGEPLRAIGFTQDISDRKAREEELRHKNIELDAANAELERYAYTVSHDLKSPLFTIQGFSAMVEERLRDSPDEELKADLAHIRMAAASMYKLLDDLLELSRVGRTVNPAEQLSLDDVVRSSISLVDGLLKKSRVQIAILQPLPQVIGDRQRLQEVFQNLIENSIKYLGVQRKPRIEIGMADHDRGRACFVRDNGIGIDPRYHEKVFGLFERLQTDTDGTGIGLALVKRIIELHHGQIWIESRGEGHGTTVWFTLPWEQSTSARRKEE